MTLWPGVCPPEEDCDGVAGFVRTPVAVGPAVGNEEGKAAVGWAGPTPVGADDEAVVVGFGSGTATRCAEQPHNATSAAAAAPQILHSWFTSPAFPSGRPSRS